MEIKWISKECNIASLLLLASSFDSQEHETNSSVMSTTVKQDVDTYESLCTFESQDAFNCECIKIQKHTRQFI